MRGLPAFADPNLLVGTEHFADAAVYRLVPAHAHGRAPGAAGAPGLAIVQTIDFFPPIVDDPFVFGQIAAANALSDVYAMGGRPITALNVVAFPDNELDLSVLTEILRGGAERVAAAGAVVAGGHSLRDKGIIYGLSVTGVVDPAQMMTNAAARPGDALVLTKPLGTGFVTTALRARQCPDVMLAAAIASMTQLNDAAAAAAVAAGARAATDVTGYGLAGHALHLAEASGVTLVIDVPALPRLAGVADLVRATHFSRANKTNREYVKEHLRIEGRGADPAAIEFLYDPQTSGGLLIAVAAARAADLVARCRRGGLEHAAIIGSVQERDRVAGHILLVARS